MDFYMNKILKIKKNSENFPSRILSIEGLKLPDSLQSIGNPEILRNNKTALFCSSVCPPGLIIKALDFAGDLRKRGTTVIGGFHSPVEREMLNILLGGKQSVIICPARSLENMRIKPEYRQPLEKDKLLLLSSFEPGTHRMTSETSFRRNLFVAAIADEIVIVHSSKSGKVEEMLNNISNFANKIIKLEKYS